LQLTGASGPRSARCWSPMAISGA